LKLRWRLLVGWPGTLPAACQLPDGYALEISSGRTTCALCDAGPLLRCRTSRRRPVSLMLGCPRVRLIHQVCAACGRADSLEVYTQEIPPGGNYGYDLIVEVGLARFRDNRQDAEIQAQLRERWNLRLPASSIGLLADSFLDGLAALHQAYAPRLREQLECDGGYTLHLDGTCEAGTDVLFPAIAGPRDWVLDATKMATENQEDVTQLLVRCVARFGSPLATMRDLNQNIGDAIRKVIPEARDLICHYHFLKNVGSQLCEQPYAKLGASLRRLKVAPALRSIRKELVRWSRKGGGLSSPQIKQILSDPATIADLPFLLARRFVAYLLLRWLDDYKADLQGEYFPFDLPHLALYRRGHQLAVILSEIVARPSFPEREWSTLKTIAGHLRCLLDDPEVVAVAARLEKAAALFQELRQVMRLDSRPVQSCPGGSGPTQPWDTPESPEQLLNDWRDRLRERRDQELDEHKRSDQSTVLKYLEKYHQQLVGHVIELPGNRPPLIVSRTNNLAEHCFGSRKQGLRRRVGVKKLTRQIQATRPEVFLVANLAQPDYLQLVLDGDLANLPKAIAQHWPLAQAIRRTRLQSTTNRPMPTTKKLLRQPKLLETIVQAITKTMEAITKKQPHAA
jgi:hypothetical protein